MGWSAYRHREHLNDLLNHIEQIWLQDIRRARRPSTSTGVDDRTGPLATATRTHTRTHAERKDDGRRVWEEVGGQKEAHKLKLIYLTRLARGSQRRHRSHRRRRRCPALIVLPYPAAQSSPSHLVPLPHTHTHTPCLPLSRCLSVSVAACACAAGLRIIFGIIITMSPCFASSAFLLSPFPAVLQCWPVLCSALLCGAVLCVVLADASRNFSAHRHHLIYCLRCLARSLVVYSVK